MPRQAERYPLDLNVHVHTDEKWRRAVMEDISRTGMFLATSPIDVGTRVVVALDINGIRVATPAHVKHCLSSEEATQLCRTPGVGLAFREPVDAGFAAAIESLVQGARKARADEFHIAVADSEPRVIERLSTALASAGFSVATASNGLELFGACLRQRPDAVLVDRATPVFDAYQIIERFSNDNRLATVPIVMTTTEGSDIEYAFDRGVTDVILKPFTLVEAIARMRRAAATPKRTERILLGGSVGELGLASVMTMMELERKSGRLVVTNGGHAAWVDIVDGRIVDAGWSLGTSHPRAVVLALLDWVDGSFKLVAPPTRRRETEFAMPITHMILEQARLRDEAARVS